MSTKNKECKKSSEISPNPMGRRGLFSFDEFDDFCDDFMSRKTPNLSDWDLSSGLNRGFPRVDIVDYENHIKVEAALPGINKDDIDISINNQSITISAKSNDKKEQTSEDGQFFRREISRGEFTRSLLLPDGVDDTNISAKFKDGILNINIPKTEKSKRKNIAIE